MKVERELDFLLDKFSNSKLATFGLCPRKAYYRYVARRDAAPPSYPLVAGNAMHTALEADAYAKLDNRPLRIMQVHEAAVAAYEEQANKANEQGAKYGGKDLDKFSGDAARQLGRFEENGIRESLVPVENMVEAPFEVHLMVGGIPALIEGFIDLGVKKPEGGLSIVDYKVVGRPVSAKEAAKHGQLALEIYAAGAEDGRIINFIKSGQQKANCKETPPVPSADIGPLMTQMGRGIFEFRRAHKAESWPQRTFDYMCHSCEFFSICPGRGAPEKPQFVQITDLKKAGTLPQAEWRQSSAAKNRKGST